MSWLIVTLEETVLGLLSYNDYLNGIVLFAGSGNGRIFCYILL